jgi:glycosyltransferase involved in cell wall biosynthesis
MKKIVIHQITPTMSMGDAISNEVLAMQNLFQQMGIQGEIYAKNIDSRLSKKVRDFRKYKGNKQEIILHHFGIGSDVNDYVRELKNTTKIIRYHNITPAEFFEGYSPVAHKLCSWGREQLAVANKCYQYGLADSHYNKEELIELGYKNIGVIPILLALDDYKKQPDEKIIQAYKSDQRTTVMFLGRIAPNKKQEDVIRAFYYYKKYFDKGSRLLLVGSYNGMERYYEQLQGLVKALELEDVIFTGHIPFKEILAYYHVADVFLCMSEHEGFCVPLVESMFFKIPIIAYNSSAIPSTLEGSGILANQKDYIHIAGMIDYVMKENFFKEKVIEKQLQRLEELSPKGVVQEMEEYFSEIVGVGK